MFDLLAGRLAAHSSEPEVAASVSPRWAAPAESASRPPPDMCHGELTHRRTVGRARVVSRQVKRPDFRRRKSLPRLNIENRVCVVCV